jgi:hypothetical protein
VGGLRRAPMVRHCRLVLLECAVIHRAHASSLETVPVLTTRRDLAELQTSDPAARGAAMTQPGNTSARPGSACIPTVWCAELKQQTSTTSPASANAVPTMRATTSHSATLTTARRQRASRDEWGGGLKIRRSALDRMRPLIFLCTGWRKSGIGPPASASSPGARLWDPLRRGAPMRP